MQFRALVAAVIVFVGAGEAIASTECEKHQGDISWAYCVTRTEGSTNPDILYFLHGIFNDETRWNTEELTLGIQARWKAAGVAAPTVVAVNFGRVALLSEPNESRLSGLLDTFVDVAIPEIEKKLGWSGGRRLLFGESMGGFNALQAYLKSPELFARAALACPAITTIGPQASIGEIRAYMKRTHAKLVKVATALAVARAHFPSPGSWMRSAPLELARTRLRAGQSPLFVSIAEHDDYGFQEGDASLINLAREAGIDVQSMSAPVHHCKVSPVEIADFLAKP